MTKNQLKLILSAAIFGFGLVSCSKESEVKYVEDNYRPGDILVEKSDKSFTALDNLTTMDFSRHLVINDENTAPNNAVKNLVLSTTCRAQSGTVSSTQITTWPNPTAIKILDILPTDVLLERKSEPVYCDIGYTTTNTFGSTNTGKVSQVKILSADSFSNLSADHVFSAERVSYAEFEARAVVQAPNALSTIACDDFSYSLPNLPAEASLAQILPFRTIQDARPKSASQRCRIIFRTDNAVQLSRVFTLMLPFAPPTIGYTFSKRSDGDNVLDSNQKINYRIANPNVFPIAVKLALHSKSLRFRPLFRGGGSLVSGQLQELLVEWSIDGKPISPESYDSDFIIPPQTTVHLDAGILGSVTCLKNFLGFNFGVNDPVVLTVLSAGMEGFAIAGAYAGPAYASKSDLPAWDYVMGGAKHAWIHTIEDDLYSLIPGGKDGKFRCY